MRNSINASTINVIVDRQDRVNVAGIMTLRGSLPLHQSPRASYSSATVATTTAAYAPAATATGPGSKSPGKLCVLGGKRPQHQPLVGQPLPGQMHHEMSSVVMSERLPNSWRASRRFTFTSRRFAAA